MKNFFLIVFTISSLLASLQSLIIKTGDDLQQFKDPCASLKCTKEETCIVKDAENAICMPTKLVKISDDDVHSLKKRQALAAVCVSNECRHGECEVITSTTYKCHCLKGITGVNCDLLSNSTLACSSNPCYGNSTCIDLDNGHYICLCGYGRSGPDCRAHLSPCLCQNGGSCIQQNPNVYSCKCPYGYGGDLCQYSFLLSQPGKSCLIRPCENGGTCTLQSFCLCPMNFSGNFCETYNPPTTKPSAASTFFSRSGLIPFAAASVDVCYPGICQNGGTCIPISPNLARCSCVSGWTGLFCNILTSTSSSPAQLALCPANPCQNGGTCLPATGSTFTCQCATGWGGPFCNIPTTSVTTSATNTCPLAIGTICRNGGTCRLATTSSSSTIVCSCTATYTGTYCETQMPFCSTNPCLNGGTCTQTDSVNGQCSCVTGYSGNTCNVLNTCNPNPCKDNQPCLTISGVQTCVCLNGNSPASYCY